MATEGSATDSATHKQVEDMKMGDDIKHVNEECVSQPTVLEGKYDKEKLEVVDAATVEASADESNALVEDVKKEETKEESMGEATEKELESEVAEKTEDNSEVPLVQESKSEAEKAPAVAEALTEEMKAKDDFPSASESTGKASEKELESEAAEKSEDNSEVSLTQESKDEAEKEPAVTRAVAEELKAQDDLPSASESMGEATEKEPESEALEKSEDTSEIPLMQEPKEPAVAEAVAEEMKAKDDLPSASESTGEATEKEPEFEAAENLEDNLEAPLMQESEVEAEKEPAVAEAVAEEMKVKDFLPPASETKHKEAQSEAVITVEKHASDISATPDASKIAEVIINEIFLAEVEVSSVPSKEEPFSDVVPVQVAAAPDTPDAIPVDTTETNKAKNAEAVLAVVLDTPEKTDYNTNADDGIEEPEKEESTSGETEALKKSTDVKEKEGKATEGEDPPLSKVFKDNTVTEFAEVLSQGGDAEKPEKCKVESLGGDKAIYVEISKDLDAPPVAEVLREGVKATGDADLVQGGTSLEGDKMTLVDTSRDLDVVSTVNDDSKVADSEAKVAEVMEDIIDKSVNEDSEDKKDENEKAAEAKNDGHKTIEGEALKEEIPIKSSQRQSNNILTKMKQSIVKVKKAIIGKSPSSKTMSSEGKDDIKVK